MAVELQQQQQPQDYQQQIYFQTMEEVHLPKDIFDEDFKKNESFVSNKVITRILLPRNAKKFGGSRLKRHPINWFKM